MKTISIVLLMLATALLTACGSDPAQPTPQPVVEETQGIVVEGKLQPVAYQEQSFSIPGQVAEVLVQDGEEVTAGQALARLTASPQAELALASAQQEALAAQQALAELERNAEVDLAQQRMAVQAAITARDEARKAYEDEVTNQTTAALSAADANLHLAEERLDRLGENQGVDPDAFAAAQARIVTASAAAASAEDALAALELRASMDGTVIDLDLQPGRRVIAGETVLTLADTSQWVVVTDTLTENEVVEVEVGQPVQVSLQAVPGLRLNGEVTHINARFEEKGGDITYSTTVYLQQSDPVLRWGMTASVQFNP